MNIMQNKTIIVETITDQNNSICGAQYGPQYGANRCCIILFTTMQIIQNTQLFGIIIIQVITYVVHNIVPNMVPTDVQ